MAKITVRAKYLYDGGAKFYAKGVSYGPFAPNSRGERYPEPARAAADFALMRELGANVVRTYVAPPAWMFETAALHGLRLMVGFPWAFHMAFLDSKQMRRDIRLEIRKGVGETRQYRDAIFAYTLGNEIRSDIVRWHGPRAVSNFLRELYEIGKSLDPEGLFTYANYPSAEYLELNFLDFLSFNVYLHRESDFRRYLTHLLAKSADRPVVLSETGLDTIREGEEHQAGLLGWQSRAAFETGLSGFIVFAFTDAWHTGGSEITDWAFGLVTRERTRKRAFVAVAKVFNGSTPAPLSDHPKVSVVVASYNAASTLGACLDSLSQQTYPSFEVIVVDDGSTDSTSSVAHQCGARVLRAEHQGLSAARNLGIAQATGTLVAFIDADAEADRDWLYHLVETITRRNCVAAGGPNFPPKPQSALMAAIAAAPGAPREVRLEDENLLQLCGCNMAIRKAALEDIGGFDPGFTTAGDDVDISVGLRAQGETLACAAAATVIHRSRTSLSAYLAQQRGYGAAEARLFLKYPNPAIGGGSVYGAEPTLGWLWRVLKGASSPRVYYGAFGRGLFQTVYSERVESLLLAVPVSVFWIASSLTLIAIGLIGQAGGILNSIPLFLGLVGAAISVAAACAFALLPAGLTFFARAWLAMLSLMGTLVRSYARVRGIYLPGTIRQPPESALRGLTVPALTERRPFAPDDQIERVREVLLQNGIATARGAAFASCDLNSVMPPALEVPINFLSGADGSLALKWSAKLDWFAIGAASIGGGLLFGICAQGWLRSWTGGLAVAGTIALALGALCALRLRRFAAAFALASGSLDAVAAQARSPVAGRVV